MAGRSALAAPAVLLCLSCVRPPPPSASGVRLTRGGCAALLDNGGSASEWAFFDAGDKIAYRDLNPRGDRIIDFSHAGYGGGGVAFPSVAAVETLSPSGGDDSSAIQAAIDRASARPLVSGFRGAVVLEAGTFRLTRTLRINASGVVLRGSGSGSGGTQVQLSGPPFRFLEMKGSGSADTSDPVGITDAYVPAGTRTVSVASTAGYAVGDTVFVQRPATADWIHFMGMDTLVRGGRPQTWLATSTVFRTDRVIRGISGNRITLDAPMTDSIDGALLDPPGGSLVKYSWPGRISQVGLERLRLLAPPGSGGLGDPQYTFLSMDAVLDAWAKDIVVQDCQNCISISKGAKRVTFEDVTIQHTVAWPGAPYPADYSANGTQFLCNRCRSLGARNVYTVIMQSGGTGPNVFLKYASTQQKAIEPHQRWASGLLLDNNEVDNEINLLNRGIYGSGHGWTLGWGVVWNSVADQITVQRPPGSMNWSIGSRGAIVDKPMPGGDGSDLPRGTFESHGTPVKPWSLYLAQLCSRLGPQAVHNLGY